MATITYSRPFCLAGWGLWEAQCPGRYWLGSWEGLSPLGKPNTAPAEWAWQRQGAHIWAFVSPS